MPIITKRRVRCAAQVNAPFITTPLTDFYHRQNIETVQGNSTRFEFGFLTQEGEIYDMSNVESLNLKLLPSQTEAGALADQTLAAADLDLTVNAETWADGSKQHAVFAFTNGEMNLPTGTTARKVLWLVVTAILTDGSENTLAAGNLVLHEDNNATSDPPPENPGTAITLEQADARYAALADGRLPVLELDAPPVDGEAGERATASLANAGMGNFEPGDPVEIGGVTYTAVASGAVSGEFVISFDLEDSLNNLRDAINGSDGVNSAHPDVEATAPHSGPSISIHALVAGVGGNSITLAVPDKLVVGGGGSTLSGGTADTGTAAAGLGQGAVVTTTNSSGTFRDVWMAVQVSPPLWTPPGHIFKDRTSGIYQRQFFDAGVPAYEPAYP